MAGNDRRSRGGRKGNVSRKRAGGQPIPEHTVTDGAVSLEPHDVELTSTEIRAVQLRMAGMSFTEIAQALNYANRSGAYKAVKRALEKWGWNSVDEYRKLELNRLDALTARWWTKALGRPERRDDDGNVIQEAEDPNPEATVIVMRLMERRSRLLGLDAPQHIDIGITQEEDKGEQVVDAYEKWLELTGEVIEVESSMVEEDQVDPDEDEDIVDAEEVEDEPDSGGDERSSIQAVPEDLPTD